MRPEQCRNTDISLFDIARASVSFESMQRLVKCEKPAGHVGLVKRREFKRLPHLIMAVYLVAFVLAIITLPIWGPFALVFVIFNAVTGRYNGITGPPPTGPRHRSVQ